MIKLTYQHIFHGPNPYSTEPIVTMKCDISEDELVDLSGRMQSMSRHFSEWFTFSSDSHHCSRQLLAEYLSCWALGLINLAGGFLHAYGAKQSNQEVTIWLGFHSPKFSLQALNIATQIYLELGRGDKLSEKTGKELEVLRAEMYSKNRPDFQAKILMAGARARNIPYFNFYDRSKVIQYGWGRNSCVFIESSPVEDIKKFISGKVSQKSFFQSLGFPVAPYRIARSEKDLEAAASNLTWPLIVKPADSSKSRGVTTLIESFSELQAAYHYALKNSASKTVLIEKYIPGEVHRLTVLRGSLISANLRARPFVVGDGERTIVELVDEYNATRTINRRGEIPRDDEFNLVLAKQGINGNEVVTKGRKVILRRISFQDTGAAVSDVTDLVHPDIRNMVESVAGTLNKYIVGFDYISEDISRSFTETGVLLELNQTPFLPSLIQRLGSDVEVGKAVLGDRPNRIPVILLVVENDQASLEASRISLPENAAYASRRHVRIGRMSLMVPGSSLMDNTRTVLRNRKVEALLVVVTAEELMSSGMPVDKANKVVLLANDLDEAWKDVLQKHCGDLRAFTYTGNIDQEAIACILEGFRP